MIVESNINYKHKFDLKKIINAIEVVHFKLQL